MTTKKIYIDIQSLLDIRQACLIELLGESKALEYVTTDAYNFRDLEIFPVDMDKYNQLVSQGDVGLLKNATVTYIEVLLKNKLTSLEKLNGFNNDSSIPELIVNTYPYQLKEVQVKLMQEALFIRLGVECIITFVYDHIKVWNPSYIKNNNVIAFFMYDFSGWMKEHSDKLKNGELRDVNVLFPSIGHNELTQDEMKKIKSLGFNDIFSHMEYVMAGFCRIQFLPILFYTNVVTATALLHKNKDIVESHMNKTVEEHKETILANLEKTGVLNDDIK